MMSSLLTMKLYLFTLFVILCNYKYVNGKNISIDTELGTVLGIEEDGYYTFKGIPYVENPPIGNYRFTKMNVKNSSYDNNFYDATYFRKICFQSLYVGYPRSSMSEDCLQINIWTPTLNTTASLPGM